MHKNLYLSLGLVVIGSICLPQAGRADNLNTRASNGSGSHWNQNIWVTNAPGDFFNTTPLVGPPVAGNTYGAVANAVPFTFSIGNNTGNNTRLRNPTASGSSQTFAGDSLTLTTNTEIRFKVVTGIPANSQTVNFPGVNGEPGLILSGGVINNGDPGIWTILGSVKVEDGSMSLLAPGGNFGNVSAGLTAISRSLVMGAVMSGSGALAVVLTPTNNPILVTNGQNTFNGDWIIQEGWLIGTTPQCLGSANITVDPLATIPVYPDLGLETSTTVGSGPGTNAAYAILDFAYDGISTGTLILTNGGLMNLHSHCAFVRLIIEGETLADDVYTYDQLSSTYTNFLPGGSGSITIAPPVPPIAPTGLATVTGPGGGEVTISWQVTATATGYEVARSSVSGGHYTPVGSTNLLALSDTGLADGQLYYYVVYATNAFGSSPASAEIVGRPSQPVSGVTLVTNATSITLNWSTYADATNYVVKRATVSSGPYTTLTNVTATTATDDSVGLGSVYYYEVVASLNNGFSSAPSAPAAALTFPHVPGLAAQLHGTNAIKLVMTTTDAVAPDYVLEMSANGSTFDALTTVPSGASIYVVPDLTPGATYYFRATAQNPGGVSSVSAVASNTIPVYAISINFGTGGATPTPVPPGYLPDFGSGFGDQGNGFIYGWHNEGDVNSPVDISGNARYNATATPDVRYNSFMLQQKNLIQPYPQWSIVVSNGYYQVHMVSGDQTATDSTFRQNVNDVLTTTVPAGGGVFFAEWTILCSVTNELLTLSPATNASNCKINFLDIYPFSPAALDALVIFNPALQGGTFSGSFQSVNGAQYEVRYTTDLSQPVSSWTILTSIPGNGGLQDFADAEAGASGARYYVVVLLLQ